MRTAGEHTLKMTATPGTLTSYAGTGSVADATSYSEPLRLDHLENYSIQVDITGGGSPVGSLKLQFSNTKIEIPPTGIPDATTMKWTDVASSSQAVGADDTYGWNSKGVGYRWVRVVWTKTSGTGTMTCVPFGKGAT